MDINTSGFDELADDLDELAENAEELDGENRPPEDDVFTDSFMRSYTDFDSFDGFLDASPWEVESESDFESIPDDEFDEYVNQHTQFPNWEEMYETAGTEWVAGQLGF